MLNQTNTDNCSYGELYQRTRSMKRIFEKIIDDYLLYDPVTKEDRLNANSKSDFSLFTIVSPNDSSYVNKMKAILLVLYYSVKNRGYNYTLPVNTSHIEILKCEFLREWLENNSDYICNGNAELTNLMSALMVLLYDKILVSKLEIVHKGKDVPTSISTFNITNNFSYSKINYTNTTKVKKIKAIKIMALEEHKERYIERRNYWKENTSLPENKNFFLYGTYNLKEINDFLAQFYFKLPNITTSYYENYFCKFINPFTITVNQIKTIVYFLTDNRKKLNELKEKHRIWWPIKLLIKSFFVVFLRAITVIIPLYLIFMPFGEKVAMIVSLIPAYAVFLPPVNRKLEKKKRKIYSLFN